MLIIAFIFFLFTTQRNKVVCKVDTPSLSKLKTKMLEAGMQEEQFLLIQNDNFGVESEFNFKVNYLGFSYFSFRMKLQKTEDNDRFNFLVSFLNDLNMNLDIEHIWFCITDGKRGIIIRRYNWAECSLMEKLNFKTNDDFKKEFYPKLISFFSIAIANDGQAWSMSANNLKICSGENFYPLPTSLVGFQLLEKSGSKNKAIIYAEKNEIYEMNKRNCLSTLNNMELDSLQNGTSSADEESKKLAFMNLLNEFYISGRFLEDLKLKVINFFTKKELKNTTILASKTYSRKPETFTSSQDDSLLPPKNSKISKRSSSLPSSSSRKTVHALNKIINIEPL